MDTIKEILSRDLKIAMVEKDMIAVNAIRTLRARIDNAEAPLLPSKPASMQMAGGIAGASSDSRETEIPRKELSLEDIQNIIESEIADTEHALEMIRNASLVDRENLADQLVILKRYCSIGTL